jgi:hypothetical protein
MKRMHRGMQHNIFISLPHCVFTFNINLLTNYYFINLLL